MQHRSVSLNGSEIDLNPLIPSASLKHPSVLQIDPPNVITTDAGSMYICIAVMSKLLLLRTPKITMAIPPIIESSDAISMNYTFHFLKLGIPMDLPTKSIKIPFYMILLNFLSLVYFLFVKKGVKSQKNVGKQSKNHFPTIFQTISLS